MECVWNWEHKTLISELTQGMELTKQLRIHSNSTCSVETREVLLQRILSSFEKALLILKWSGSVGQSQQLAPMSGMPESSFSVEGSPRSEEFEKGFKDYVEHRDVSKKRKLLPTWTDQVRVCSEDGLEGPIDDGYSWRKYGQKDILGAKYPRSYYRCTYRNVQSCWATKQVQRSDEDPTIFEITYRGKHTCNQAPPLPPASPEKQDHKQINHQNQQKQQQQQQQPNELLLNFRTNLRVNTEDLDYDEMTSSFAFPSTSFECLKTENQNFPFSALSNENLMGSISPSFISPATSESNHFSVSPCQMTNFGGVLNLQHSESDLTDIISANTSAANSPIVDLDFSDLDQNFLFDASGFFT